MEKIPTLFRRGEDHKIYDQVAKDCGGVSAGRGYATVKIDGTACRLHGGILFKRLTLKPTKKGLQRMKSFYMEDGIKRPYILRLQDYDAPKSWMPAPASADPVTGKWPGWVMIDAEAPEDRWYREGWEHRVSLEGLLIPNQTYELVGPKVQGNPYGLQVHTLVPHGIEMHGVPTDFEGLRGWLFVNEVEGVVWHWPRPKGTRYAKIKRRDFGLDWPLEGRFAPLPPGYVP